MKWLTGSQQNGAGRELTVILLYVAWGLFVNLCVIWILTPLVQDLALLGVVCLLGIVGLWLFSIPVSVRRPWWVFTVASILFGQGLLQWSLHPVSHPVILIVLMSIGLVVLTCWFGRIPVLRFVAAISVLAIINAWVPIRAWAFLTHFSVALETRIPLNTDAFSQAPLLPVRTPAGQAVITLEDTQRTMSGPFLRQTYHYVAIERTDSRWAVHPATSTQLSALNPYDVIGAASPLYPMSWTVERDTVSASLQTAVKSKDFAQMTTGFANVPADTAALLQREQDSELQGWTSALQKVGVHSTQAMQIENGVLTGRWQGHRLQLKVGENHIIGMGAFTEPAAHELLLEGPDALQVVSLDGSPRVVSTFRVDVRDPIAGDLLIGPFSTTGKDAVYVNGSPARILTLDSAGRWHQAYAADHSQLRFLSVAQFPGEQSPEIFTDDPGDVSAQPGTNYFTSYTYRSGHLVRNWRIFRADVASLVPVQPSPHGAVVLVGSLSGTNGLIVLTRHHLPLLPPTAALLGLSIGCGYVLRVRDRRGSGHA